MVTAPAEIRLHRQSRALEIGYADGRNYRLPCEYLRVFSPSAEVHGHGGGEPTLVPGKQNVNIARIEPVGQYAVRLKFDDGHDTGLYSWQVLDDLARNHDEYWAYYLRRMRDAGLSRDPQAVRPLSTLINKQGP
jgi:DUF971 family protein